MYVRVYMWIHTSFVARVCVLFLFFFLGVFLSFSFHDAPLHINEAWICRCFCIAEGFSGGVAAPAAAATATANLYIKHSCPCV